MNKGDVIIALDFPDAPAVYAFLAIRHDGVSMLDFLRYAGVFFFGRQRYEWRQLP